MTLLLTSVFHTQPPVTAEEIPLYEQRPFDVIVLRDEAETRVRIEPLIVSEALDPAGHDPNERLRVQFPDRLHEEYEIRWGDVARILRFEQVLLEEAQQLVVEGKYSEAYDYFRYLQSTFPRLEGLDQAIAEFLFAEASAAEASGRADLALVSYSALYERRPDFPGLLEKLEAIYTRPIEEALAADEYRRARAALAILATRLPQSEAIDRWRGKLRSVARQWSQQASEHLERKNWREAQTAARRAVTAWPEDPEIQRLWREAYARYPIVEVGVRQFGGVSSSLADWDGRRVARLVERRLFEAIGYSEEGTQYSCALGTATVENLGLGLTIDLDHGLRWDDDKPLAAADVARELAELCRKTAWPGIPLADWLASVAVPDVYRIQVELTRPHLRPEALLALAVRPRRYVTPGRSFTASQPWGLGPYRRLTTNGDSPGEQRFVVRGSAVGVPKSAPREVIERRFASDAEAMAALESGQITVVDRVAPWTRLRNADSESVRFAPYAAPLVHALLVEGDDPLLADRTFRRAILYALDRRGLLFDEMLATDEAPGFAVLSAPLPMGYAYDPNLEPRPYEPALALTLASLARRRMAASGKQAVQDSHAAVGEQSPDEATARSPDAPRETNDESGGGEAAGKTYILAHPPSDFARRACRLIRQSLARVGISVSLVEYGSDDQEDTACCDLRYVELAITEPIVDVYAICQMARPIGADAQTYQEMTLRRLRQATDWREARSTLRELHRMLHDDLRLIPLWQTTEYYAVRRDVAMIDAPPIVLYDHLLSWQVTPPESSEVAHP